MIRPKLAGTCGTAPADTVEVQIVVDRYFELDQTNQVFEFDGYLRAWWNDPRLAYNASECTAPRLLLSPEQVQSMVWTPDFIGRTRPKERSRCRTRGKARARRRPLQSLQMATSGGAARRASRSRAQWICGCFRSIGSGAI